MTISINTASLDEDGRIRNRYIGTHDGEEWIAIPDDEWPTDEGADDEIARYYYDSETGDVWIEYETVDDDSPE